MEKEKTDAKYLENKKGEPIGLGQQYNREIQSPRQRGFKYYNGGPILPLQHSRGISLYA